MEGKWECIGFEFPAVDEEYPESVVKVIMDMRVSPVRISKKEADVISAAPELLEALENLVTDVGRYSQYPSHSIEIDAGRAAIAKARGES